MKRGLVFAFLAVWLHSCSFGFPTDDKAEVIRNYFENVINANVRDKNLRLQLVKNRILELTDVKKIDGMEKNGTYYYSFEVTLKALHPFCDAHDMFLAQPEVNTDYAEGYDFIVLLNDCKEGDFRYFPQGTIFKLRGELPLEKTESGWRLAVDPQKGPQSYEYMDKKFYKLKSEIIRPNGNSSSLPSLVGVYVCTTDEDAISFNTETTFQWQDEFGPVVVRSKQKMTTEENEKIKVYMAKILGINGRCDQCEFLATVKLKMGDSYWDYSLFSYGTDTYLIKEEGGRVYKKK